jgi:hypothetical protein
MVPGAGARAERRSEGSVDVTEGAQEVRWPRRVPKQLIRRLYEHDARGIVDAEAIDRVGWMLHERCRAILVVEEARRGRVLCPRCERAGVVSHALRDPDRDAPFTCGSCGWSTTWREYASTYKRRQLNLGGAGPAFRRFVEEYPRLGDPRERMLAIDRLIHAFHYSLRERPDVPTRAAGVNVIEGKLSDVVAFLDSLAYSEASACGTGETRRAWRRELDALPWCPGRSD